MRHLKGTIAVFVGSVAVAACGSSPSEEEASSSTSQAISASDIMARANDYLTHNIVYCGGPRGGEDETGCGEGICEQPAGPWDGYRSDCSGFVSYVWQIPSDPDTATFSYDQTGGEGWSTIGIDDLKAGDAVVAEGHIKLFDQFEGSRAALIYEEYDCNLIAHKDVQGFSRSGNQIWFDGDDRAYHAIRRNALTPPPKPKPGPPTPLPHAPTAPCGAIALSQGLAPGRAIRSCDNRFELVLQGNGNLVEYGPVGVMWTTQTGGSDGYAAKMQSDGNFVLYGKTSDALWSTRTNGHPGSRLELQSDGNIVIYDGSKALWASNTEFTSPPPALPKGTCGTIPVNRGLAAGQSVKSCNGRFTLAMQADGNFVLYEGSKALWDTHTEGGKHAYKADMQGDGNLVIYDWHARPVWSSNTAGHPGAVLDLQSDGNLVIYAPGGHAIWSSGT